MATNFPYGTEAASSSLDAMDDRVQMTRSGNEKVERKVHRPQHGPHPGHCAQRFTDTGPQTEFLTRGSRGTAPGPTPPGSAQNRC